MAASLLEKGVDGPRIIQDTFYEKSYAQNQILGGTFERVFFLWMDAALRLMFTQEEMEFCGLNPKDLDGIVSELRVTKRDRGGSFSV